MFNNTTDLKIVNSNLSIAGGDIHHHTHTHTHYHSERVKDIRVLLELVPNFRDIYYDMLEKVTPGTGMWLIEGAKFRVWLEPNGDIKIFWGLGIPGAGKSVLATIVIHRLEALRKESGGSICVCYVYFRYSDRTEMTVRDILKTMVKQIMERHPECHDLIDNAYAEHLKEGSEPTVAQLLELLQGLAGRMRCTFYVLDALDEAPTKIQLSVVKTLASLNVKLFITSRPLETVQGKCPQAYTFAIFAQDTDLDLHIAKVIDESADLQYLLEDEDPLLKGEIISAIKRKCGGMFLHASLQLEALRDCINAQQVRRRLNTFPSKIEDVYTYTWERILNQNAENVSLAKAVFVWVLCAKRSMTVEELRMAIATSPETYKFEADRMVPRSTLISLCRGLVTVEEESGIVRLVHYTAKDPLERLIHESFHHPHALLATICMNHLTQRGFQNTTIRSETELITALKGDPLLAYASEAWHYHVLAGLDVEENKHRSAQFVKECRAFPAFTLPGQPWTFDILTAPLHILAVYKLPISLIEGTPMGSLNVPTTIRKHTTLIAASFFGYDDFVAHLIGLPETQVNLADRSGWTALIWAAQQGQEGVVELLLAHPAIEVNSVDSRGRSALIHAAVRGLERVVELLLAHPGIQVNLVDVVGRSALLLAAETGCPGMIKLFLAHPGILANLTDRRGRSALMRAAMFGRSAAVELLLNSGAFDINAFNNYRDTALKTAAYWGQEAVVRLLLDVPGIDTTIRSARDGHTAMSAAQEKGHSTIAQLLRDFEARRAAAPSTPETKSLSLDDTNDEEGPGSGSEGEDEESYYDAEEGNDLGDF